MNGKLLSSVTLSSGQELEIREGDVDTLIRLCSEVPEFEPPFLNKKGYREKTAGARTLILIATLDGQPAGFKAGYTKVDSFYSWLGAVFPPYRRLGVAKALARIQEDEVRKWGQDSITFKTRNCHRNMLIFAFQNGFQITGFDARPDNLQSRILLEKKLK